MPAGLRVRTCHYCNQRQVCTRDHIVPKALGGVNAGWNIVRACVKCNSRKGHKPPTCLCPTCCNAILRWAAGERNPIPMVPEHVVQDMLAALTCVQLGCRSAATCRLREEPPAVAPALRCLVACQRYGCAFPRNCMKED